MNNRNIADFLKSHHFIFSNPSRFTNNFANRLVFKWLAIFYFKNSPHFPHIRFFNHIFGVFLPKKDVARHHA